MNNHSHTPSDCSRSTALYASPRQWFQQLQTRGHQSYPGGESALHCHNIPLNPTRPFDYNPRIFHIIMLLSHLVSEMALFAASHMPSARCPTLPMESFLSTHVFSHHPGSSHAHSLQGTADKTVPYKYASKIQALVPQAKLVTITDVRMVTKGDPYNMTISSLHLLDEHLGTRVTFVTWC